MATGGTWTTSGCGEQIPGDLRDAYLARARLTKARRDQIIISEGSETGEVYLIRSGRVQISLISPHGREVILRDLGADHIFGELSAIDRLPRSANVVALEDCLLAQLKDEEFREFLGAIPQAGLWMSRLLAARIRDLTERAFELATLPVAGRVHKELLRLAAGTGAAGDHVALGSMPTHADLAARIGTHREAVTRELNVLVADGYLLKAGRTMEISSVTRLRSLYERMRR